MSTGLAKTSPLSLLPPASSTVTPTPTRLRAAAFETSAIGCAIIDLSGACVDVNAALCDMLGYPREDLLGLPILDLTHEDDQRPSQALMVALKGGDRDGVVLQKRYVHASGEIVWARLSAHVVRDSSGVATHFVSIMEDQTALHRAQSRAVSAERHFKETLNKAAVGVLLTSEAGRFLSVNRMFADMLGYAPEELEGESFRTFSAPEDLPTNAHRRSALWSGDVERVVAEKRWVHRAGHRVWTRMTISISRELAASEPFSIAIVEDITAAKQIEEAQRLLVGELNHRVKNTLAVVQGMIKRTLANTPDPQTFASLIEGRLQSISMAHDLLSQSDWRDLDLMRLFNRAVLQVFPAHASAFVFDCEPVDLAPHQTTTLALIFHELTTNAIKHGALSTSRGRVHLSAKRREIAPTNETSQPTETLCIVWEEVGGPVITDTPDRKGFGSFLLNRGIAHSLGGKATHHFARTGLVVRAELPLATPVSADDTAQRSQPTPQSVETVKPTGQTPHQRITGQSLL